MHMEGLMAAVEREMLADEPRQRLVISLLQSALKLSSSLWRQAQVSTPSRVTYTFHWKPFAHNRYPHRLGNHSRTRYSLDRDDNFAPHVRAGADLWTWLVLLSLMLKAVNGSAQHL